jgi:hypothetical protein
MATIGTNTNEKIYQLKRWLGLNENPDGDTKLKMGEASVCRNWRVTRDGNLQRRPGQRRLALLSNKNPITGLWCGRIGGDEYMIATIGSTAYKIYDGAVGDFNVEEITGASGQLSNKASVFMFGFNEKCYFLDGVHYCEWDGTTFQAVTGYVPVVAVSTPPAGGGTALEPVNKLTAKRRVRFSPDGTATVFQLPEKNIASVNSVVNRVTETSVTGWTANTANGTVTFTTAPSTGTNTIEITYTASGTDRAKVEGMRFAELYNGTQDNRVFLYGDGSNQVIYSGLDEDGNPRADYFPDLNVANIGAENTPVTGLIRHYSRLVAFKTDSTYSITYGSITLADGNLTAGFYVVPVNRTIGNDAIGQVALVLNSPRTLFGGDVYEWRNNGSYNLSTDERQARRISDRVYSTLSTFDLSRCVCFDDNANQEYYVCYNGTALVHNYAADAWFTYTNIPATCFASFRGELYFGTDTGSVMKLSESARDDLGTAIDAYWESGAMDFGADYRRKYSSMLWVSVKPQSNSYVELTLITDRKSEFADKAISTGVYTGGFADWDFRTFSFATNIQPQVKKIRLKAKKFGYYRLVFKTDHANTTATVLGVDIRVRQTGYVK